MHIPVCIISYSTEKYKIKYKIMKRELKESLNPVISLDVTAMAKEYPQADFNAIRDEFVELGAIVDGDKSTGSLLMVVNGLTIDEIEEVLDNNGIEEIQPGEFIKCDDCVEECNESDMDEEEIITEDDEFIDEDEFPEYDDVDLDEVGADESDLYAKCVEALNKAIAARVVVSEDDIDDEAYSLIEDVLDGQDPDDLDDEEYNNTLDILHKAWSDTSADVDVDDDDEYQPRFEKMRRAHHMDEKKKPCCPGKKVSLFEALKAFNEADKKKLAKSEEAVKTVVNDVKATTIGEAEAREALKKLKAENTKLQKIAKDEKTNFNVKDVQGVTKTLRTIANAGLEQDVKKFEAALKAKVEECLKANKESLHENVRINGKSLSLFSMDELKSILEKLEVSIKSLNESVDAESISKKTRLMEFVDQEITYRTIKAEFLNEDVDTVNEEEKPGDVISDEELANMFGPGQGEKTPDEKTEDAEEENSEEKTEDTEEKSEDTEDEKSEDTDEVVEVSRIVITLKNKEAADTLKQACIDAEIPEDAIEVEPAEDETEETEDETEDTPTEEPAEDETEETTDETTEEETEEPNESIHYKNIQALLFEGEETSEADETEDTEDTEDAPAEDTEDEDAEDENKQYKFILVDTDYAEQLADVLLNNYNISKEEFEEMIGGEIVKDETEDTEEEKPEESDEKNDDDTTEDTEKEDTKEESDEKEESEEDTIDTSDLFKGL